MCEPSNSSPDLWDAPARAGALRGGAVEVWRLDLRQSRRIVEVFSHQISGAERARASRFRQVSDHDAFVLTRGVLRQLLSAYLARDGQAVSAEAVELARGAHGKPRVARLRASDSLEFSVSHSGDYALLGFGRNGAIGVDIERVDSRRNIELIVEHHFTPNEAAAVRGESDKGSKASQVELFYRFWTRKEAYIKALGEGMSLDLRSFEVGLQPGANLAWSARDDAARWRFYGLNPGGGHLGAICMLSAPEGGGAQAGGSYLRTMTATVSNSASVQLDL